MTKVLTKKTYIWIFLFLSVLIAAAFLITCNAYGTLLKNDFLEKQSFLSDQTAYALGNHLRSLEEQIILFSNKNELPKKLAFQMMPTYSLQFESLDFWQIEVFPAWENVVAWSVEQKPASFPALSIAQIRQILGEEDSAWYPVPAGTDNPGETYLAYLRRITYDGATAGYVLAWVNPSSIEHILSLYMIDYLHSPNALFSSYTAAQIEIGAHSYPCGKYPVEPELLNRVSDAPLLANGKYLIRSDTGQNGIHLVLSGDAGQLWRAIGFIRQVFLFAYLTVILLLSFCLYFFIRKIDTVMKTLFSKLSVELRKET